MRDSVTFADYGGMRTLDYIRGLGCFTQARREQIRSNLKAASNEACVKKNRRPKGCAEFGLGRGCSIASKITLRQANCLDASPFHFGFATPDFRAVLRRTFPSRSDTTETIRPRRRV